MNSKFGFISKFEFLQDWASKFIASINPAVIHNIDKYLALKKIHYLSAIEDISGDYLEFGVFTGSSFCHSIRCCKKLSNLNPNVLKTKFYGFDSFSGFGVITESDNHSFYKDENFDTSLARVDRRVKAVSSDLFYKLIPGFFSDSLKEGASNFGIENARIIFIDSDTYISAKQALNFCSKVIRSGTFIMLDDYYSYRGSLARGVAGAFHEFLAETGIGVREVFTYGMGGVVYIVHES